MREFTREQFNKAVTEFTMNFGDEEDEASIRDGYSGRGMYGRTCIGVVGDTPAVAVQFMYALSFALGYDADDERDFVLEMCEAWTMDSMARSTIHYFPGYRVISEESDV